MVNPMNNEDMILRVLLDAPDGLPEEEIANRVNLMRRMATDGALFNAWARGETSLLSTEEGGTFTKRKP